MFRRLLTVVGLCTFLAACGGGGGGASRPGLGPAPAVPTPAGGPATAAPGPGNSAAKFVITIPPRASSAALRRPKFVDPTTAAIRFTLLTVNGSPAGASPGPVVALDNSVCTTAAGGTRTCTVSANAPVGSDVFAVETFADTAGTQKVGSGVVNVNVALNATNTAGLTLGGALDHLAVGMMADYMGSPYAYYYYDAAHRRVKASPSPGPGLSSQRVYIIPFDAQNNVILDPTPFSTAIQVAVSRPDAMTLSVTHTDGTAGGSTAPAPAPSPSASPLTPTQWPTVTVTAVTDVVTATLAPGYANPWVDGGYTTWSDFPVVGEIYASVGAVPASAPTPPPFNQYYPPYFYRSGYTTGTAPAFDPFQWLTINVTNTSAPPSPCTPRYVMTSSGYCSSPYVNFTDADASTAAQFYGYYNGYAYYQFTGPTDPLPAHITAQTNDVTYTGAYTLTPVATNSAGCYSASIAGQIVTIQNVATQFGGYCQYTIAAGRASGTIEVYQGAPRLQWSGTYGRVNPSGYSTTHVQFPSLADRSTVDVYFTDTNTHLFSGSGQAQPTFQPDPALGASNVSACGAFHITADNASVPPTLGSAGWTPSAYTSSTSTGFMWHFQVTPNASATSAVACKLIVDDGATTTYDGLPASIELDINNLVGGTIQ